MRSAPPETWLPVLRDTLAREGSFLFTLRGDSMLPTLPTACSIDIRPLPARPRLGSLIVFLSGETLIAHRLVARRGKWWTTQGDGRLAPDAPVAPQQALGLVSSASLAGKTVWPRRWEPLLALAWLARYHVLRPAWWIWRRLRHG